MTRFIRKPVFAFVLGAALAAAAFVGKAAFGAPEGGQIQACYKTSNGLLYVVGVGDRAECQPGDVPIDWSTQGPQGPAGADGRDIVNAPLAAGDTNCPYGGTAFTGAGGTTYACNGAPGADGADGADGVFTGHFAVGGSSIDVDANGIRLHGPNGRIDVDSAGIRIDSALGLVLKAATNASLQASGNASVQGSGLTTVQGSLLLLNGAEPVRRGETVTITGLPVYGPDCGCTGTGPASIN